MIKLRDGAITLHKRDGSNAYQIYINLKGFKPIRKSSGTANLDEAKQIATDLYDQSKYKIKQGVSIHNVEFSKMADRYLQSIDKTKNKTLLRKYKGVDGTIRRYLNPFFKGKNLNEISIRHITNYKKWRSTNFLKWEPSDNTIRLELNVLRMIYKTAIRDGEISKTDMPDIELGSVDTNRRPHFTSNEIKKLDSKLREFIDRSPDNRILTSRTDLRDYCLLMLGTGCRPEELMNIGTDKLENYKTKNGDNCYLISIKGKTNKVNARLVLADPVCKNIIDNRVDRYKKQGISLQKDLWPNHKDFSNIWGNFIKWSGLEYNSQGEKRVQYSLRHTYATERLQQTNDWGAVALQMGTSIKMLEKHYSHVKVTQKAEQLIDKRDYIASDSMFSKLFDLEP
jgi:integrase